MFRYNAILPAAQSKLKMLHSIPNTIILYSMKQGEHYLNQNEKLKMFSLISSKSPTLIRF